MPTEQLQCTHQNVFTVETGVYVRYAQCYMHSCLCVLLQISVPNTLCANYNCMVWLKMVGPIRSVKAFLR